MKKLYLIVILALNAFAINAQAAAQVGLPAPEFKIRDAYEKVQSINDYKGKVLVIEQGKDIENRPKTDIQRGYAGAGCFSDFKISFDPTVGGSLAKKIPEADFEYYGNLVLNYPNKFLER